MVPRLFLAALLALPSAPALAAPDAAGLWTAGAPTTLVRVEMCGANLCARLVNSVALQRSPQATDANNRDTALRGRPLKGVTILQGLKRDGDVWRGGQIYNPADGKTYAAEVSLDGLDQLKIKACILAPMCRTQTWTRAAKP